jgi:hypothetical protein
LYAQKSTVCGNTGSKRDERENQKPKRHLTFHKGIKTFTAEDDYHHNPLPLYRILAIRPHAYLL